MNDFLNLTNFFIQFCVDLYKNIRKITCKITDTKTETDNPNKPYQFPIVAIKIKREPIRIRAENPTLLDSKACNFALSIATIESGMRVITKICKLGMPSEYFGRRFSIIIGEIKITTRENIPDATNTKYSIFLCFLPLDSSESKNE